MANTYSLDFEASSSQYGSAATLAAYAPSSYTIEAWIKFESTGAFKVTLGKDDGGANKMFAFGVNASEKLYIEHYDNSGTGYFVTGSTTLSVDTWYHAAVVNNAGTFSMYLNGVAETPGTSGSYGALGDKNTPLTLARRTSAGDPAYFDGKLDDVRFWSTARSQAQISANKSLELVGNEANLIGYWKLNEGTGTSAGDETSNNNDFTLTNTPTWSTDVPFSSASGGASFLFNLV